MPIYKGKCAGEVLLEHLTHFSRILKCTPKVGHKEWRTIYEETFTDSKQVGVGYLFN